MLIILVGIITLTAGCSNKYQEQQTGKILDQNKDVAMESEKEQEIAPINIIEEAVIPEEPKEEKIIARYWFGDQGEKTLQPEIENQDDYFTALNAAQESVINRA